MRFFFLVAVFIYSISSISIAQVKLDGVISDVNNNYLNGVVVTIINDSLEILNYCLTGADGSFELTTLRKESDLMISFSMLGYLSKTLNIKNESQTFNISLESADIHLKEVKIESAMIWQRSDTLVYSVGAFKSNQDRTIGDLLKKLPGIEVNNSGGIKYKGEPINKFYIEGLDLLNKKYGIATNNLPVDAIVNVEVLENHQPVRALKDVVYTGQAAINLKLRDEKMSRPIGNINLGIGMDKKMRWNFDAFTLYAKKTHQSIVMYKTNDIGKDIRHELDDHDLDDHDRNNNKPLPSSVIFNEMLNVPPIDKGRYLFNKTHLVTINSLCKIGEHKQLKINFNYLNDIQNRENSQRSSFFLNDNNVLIIDETNKNHQSKNLINGLLTFTNNSADYYLNNSLKLEAEWDKSNLSIYRSNTGNIAQAYGLPRYNLQNSISLTKKKYSRVWNISSLFRYSSLPHDLSIAFDTLDYMLDQTTNFVEIYSNTDTYISFSKKKYIFSLGINVETAYDRFKSELNNPMIVDSVKNNVSANYAKFSFNINYVYNSEKFRLSLNFPLTQHLLFVKGQQNFNNNNLNFFYVNPQVRIRYEFNPLIEVHGSIRYTHNIGDLLDFTQSYVMQNYRNLSIRSGVLSKKEGLSCSIRLNYKNFLSTLFFNTGLYYISLNRNLLTQQRFVENFSISNNLEYANRLDTWMWTGYIGKYFSSIKTNVSLSTDYNMAKTTKKQQNEIFPVLSTLWTVSPKIETKLSNLFTVNFNTSLSYNNQIIKLNNKSSKSSFFQLLQKAQFYYSINEKININIQSEYLYNEIAKSVSINSVFLNAGVSYKIKKIEFMLEYNNIFNNNNYSYLLYNGLDTYLYRYKLRPSMIFGNVKLNF